VADDGVIYEFDEMETLKVHMLAFQLYTRTEPRTAETLRAAFIDAADTVRNLKETLQEGIQMFPGAELIAPKHSSRLVMRYKPGE
jgi:hypothetical protein